MTRVGHNTIKRCIAQMIMVLLNGTYAQQLNSVRTVGAWQSNLYRLFFLIAVFRSLGTTEGRGKKLISRNHATTDRTHEV